MSSQMIWRRRVLLMLIVGLAIAIPVTLIVRGSGESEDEPSEASLSELVVLNPAVGDSAIDAVYQVPKGWRLSREGEALTLRSADETVQIGITSPAEASQSKQVLDQALAALKGTYDGVEVNPGSGREVGGLPAEGALVTARNEATQLRIVVAVSEGKKRAYLVQVFSAVGAPPRRVAEAQRFLDSLRLKG